MENSVEMVRVYLNENLLAYKAFHRRQRNPQLICCQRDIPTDCFQLLFQLLDTLLQPFYFVHLENLSCTA